MLCNENECVGCGACAESCDSKCISMKLSEHGIIIPDIDEKRCIQCGNCIKSCPILTEQPQIKKINPQIYRGFCKEDSVLKESASGGAFTVFAKYIIESGGVVCGAAMESDYTVRYKMVADMNELRNLRSSKYVQSLTDGIYSKIKKELKSKKNVLFSGLPCHVAGLYQYLKMDYENLYTIDIVCHGTSSSTLFQNYINNIENEYNDKLIELNQASKDQGWNILIPRTIKLKFADGKIIYKNSWQDFYLSKFLDNLFFKPACYTCRFASLPRVADITLGDFFGLGVVKPVENLQRYGESMISINTPKGGTLLSQIKKDIVCEKRSLEEVLYFNHNMWRPSKKNHQWQEFYDDMISNDFEFLKNKYFDSSKMTKLKIGGRQLLKKILGYKLVAKCMLIVYKHYGICKQADQQITKVEKLPKSEDFA